MVYCPLFYLSQQDFSKKNLLVFYNIFREKNKLIKKKPQFRLSAVVWQDKKKISQISPFNYPDYTTTYL